MLEETNEMPLRPLLLLLRQRRWCCVGVAVAGGVASSIGSLRREGRTVGHGVLAAES